MPAEFVASPEGAIQTDLPAEDQQPAPPFLNIPEERLVELTNYCADQLSNYRAQIGLDLYPMGAGSPVISQVGRVGTFAWIRQAARLEYRGNYLHRRALGGVFLENGPNGGWSMNMPKRFVNALASKAEDDILGSDMFFASMPENIENPQEASLSKQVEAKVQKEIGRSNLRECLAESIRVALTEGERCVKLTYQVDKTQYMGDAEVMIVNGAPYKTPNGDYVFKKDNVLDIVVDAQGNFVRVFDGQAPLAADQVGNQTEFMQSRLEKEMSVVMPPQPVFQLVQGLPLTITHKDGLEADGLFAEDFIYDIFQPRLSLCKLMAHVYDSPVKEIEGNYPNSGYSDRLQRKLSPTGPMAQASMPIFDAGEQLRVGYGEDLINIHETYYRCRVNDDDEYESWLFLVIDMTNRLPIYAEYLGNMKMKKPPFVLLRGLRSEPGRAYGVGIYADFRDKNLAIDVTFNRLMLKDSKEGSVTFVNGAMIKEVQEGHKLVIGGKEYYTLNTAYPDEIGPNSPPVFRINLNEMDTNGWEIMDKLMASGVIEYGVTDISSLSDTNAPIAKDATATATRNIERTGNVLQKSTQRMMAGDIISILDMAVDLVLENADPSQLVWIPGEQMLGNLNREEIRNLPRDIRLTLTRSKGAEVLQTSAQATTLVQQYYSYPLSLRAKVREFFLDQLRALEVADADTVLDEPTPEDIAAEQQAQQQAKEPPKESLSIKLSDLGTLAPSERAAALQLFGIQAAPPEEVQQAALQAAAIQHPPQLMDKPAAA